MHDNPSSFALACASPRVSIFHECSGPQASHRARLTALSRADQRRTSKYRGVTFRKSKGARVRARWIAAIAEGARGLRSLGTFDTETAAALTYDLALIYLGHAPVNFPPSHYFNPAHREALERAMRDLQPRLGGTWKSIPHDT